MTLWVARSALRVMAAEAQRCFPTETGGILIGYCSQRDIVITRSTTPGPHAQHTGMRYVPDPAHDEAEMAKAYEDSGRLHTYLGDWHTHPKQDAQLSCSDRDTLWHIATHAPARNKHPLMAILAGGPDYWDLGVWAYGHRRRTAMTVQAYDDTAAPEIGHEST